MTTILKFSCKLFGYDYATLLRQPTISQQKVVTLASLMVIPVLLWMFSGFYLTRYMMGASFVASIVVAIFLGLVIFFVDRSFVSTPKMSKGFILKTVRFAFAIISTVLGSLALDMVVFSGDLAEFRSQKAASGESEAISLYKVKHGGELGRLDSLLAIAQSKYSVLTKVYLDELDGSGGTGLYGKGKVAAAKEAQMQTAAAEVERIRAEREKTFQQLQEEAEQFGEESSTKRSDALLSQIRDLHAFVFQDAFTIGFYSFFFLFVLLLEGFFILYKSLVHETIFEAWMDAEEQYAREQLESYQARKRKAVMERHILGGDYDKVHQILEKPVRKIV